MLDPTLDTYGLAVAAASGLVAAGMHGTTVLTSHSVALSRKELLGQVIRTFVVGVATCVGVRALPWHFDLLAVLLIAAVVGGVLGPRGLRWFMDAGVVLLRRNLPGGADLPAVPTDDPPSVSAPGPPADPAPPAPETPSEVTPKNDTP